MLPKIDLPIYELKLPSNGKSIKVRPFLVREEKLLLMAIESGNDEEIIETTKQVINNCLLDEEINIEKLPFFDIDYLFIALRAKSIGESISVKFTCNSYVNGKVCGHTFPANIDISNCETIMREDVSSSIDLSGGISVKMKYPSYTTMKSIMDNDSVIDKKINIIAGSIERIVKGEQVYSLKDISKEELTEFIEGLTQEQFKKLEHFVDNFPFFVIKAEADCESCGYHHHLEYKEFTSFFV